MDISLLALSFAYKVRVDHKHSKTALSSYSRQCLHFFLSEQHPTGYLLDHHRKPKLTVNDLINELMDSYDVILVLFLNIAFAILYVLV